VDCLTKPQFAEFIREACHIGKALPHEIHKKIVQLGPTCFITTNYDQLLEESLRACHPSSYFRVVTNKQITETADIIQARATSFVFKPHGDVADSDSIILSREQYRVLHGDKRHILAALETLLISRPVVFIGFGLRDLDFLYIKDILANIYKGGACDHYALMADVSDQEREYWRRNYGIHIGSYSTVDQDGFTGRDHSALLTLLDSLLSNSHEAIQITDKASAVERLSSNQLLALARYAARWASAKPKDSGVFLPLRISIEGEFDFSSVPNSSARFHGALVERFLNKISHNAILLGNPGAGKTYSFRNVCSNVAQILRDVCLSESEQVLKPAIPIYLDLKLYSGNLWQMAEQMFPRELSLEILCSSGNVRFYIDSFNEMPRTYFENESYYKDFLHFIDQVQNCPIIIGSRTIEGLQRFNFPAYQLDEIDQVFVVEYAYEHGDHIHGIYSREVLRLLQKPLFFKLYSQGKVDVTRDMHPRQLYGSLFELLANNFQEKFGKSIPLEEILSPIAYTAIDEGQEALILPQLQSQIKRALMRFNLTVCDEIEFINWLISNGILIPASGSRLAFFHQSVTVTFFRKTGPKLMLKIC
jgi:hypothetical protein